MDWADKIAQRIFTGDGGALIDKPFYRGMIAKELRTARAEGMRMAAEIADTHFNLDLKPYGAQIASAIRAAADKEEGK